MTFEEYAQKHLGTAWLSFEGIELVRMGWNARADHFRDATKMVKGNVALAGDITDQDGTTFYRSLLVQFTDDSSLRAAVDSGQCRFTVFGGEV